MFKRNFKLLLPVVSLFLLVSYAMANPAKSSVEQAYHAWCHTIGIAKGNAAQVVKFYAPGAILLPTLSSNILTNSNKGFDAYFVMFTGKKNIKCTTNTLLTHVYGNTATNSGLYTFTFTDSQGKTQTVPARFTFVYKKVGKEWLIVTQHSSKLPR